MKPLLFILGAFICFSFCNSRASDSSYLSLKKLESALKDQGIQLSKSVDEDKMYNHAGGRTLTLYFNGDTVSELKMNIVIKSDRNDLKKHFPVFTPIVSLVDTMAASWMEQELAANTDNNALEKTNIINNRYYLMNYYPDRGQDLLNIGIFYREPSFFRR